MCGIIGYIGKNNAVPFLIGGLEKLEYRGYDSAGTAVISGNNIECIKAKGRLNVLKDKLEANPISGNVGIGHTRWATHGAPLDKNSHPHLSKNQNFAIVHNGIIENYLSLKKLLKDRGFVFSSDTDSEVVAHLLELNFHANVLDAICETVKLLQGSFALGIISSYCPDALYVVKKDSPLVVGTGNEETFIASDIPALLSETRDVYLPDDGEIVKCTKDKVEFFSYDKKPLTKELFHIDWDISSAEKDGFPHFMLKEIHEQPVTVRRTLSAHIKDGKVEFDNLSPLAERIKKQSRLYITACGSAYHVGLAGKYVMENLAALPTDVWLASEFRYADPVITSDDLVILISQSGETADTLAALREAKKQGATTLAIVNVAGSTIAREADFTVHTLAGPEIAVATTKAYSCQLAMINLLAIYFARCREKISDSSMSELCAELKTLPLKIEQVLDKTALLKQCAIAHKNSCDTFYLGRGLDWCVCLEGSLKLKEISYIHSEAYAAGELKHGTISLIQKDSLVIATATQPHIFDKTLSNIKEVKARGGYVLLFLPEDKNCGDQADFIIPLPKIHPLFAPSVNVVAMQLFAYYMAAEKGCDIDKPRNLAKSVTVE